MLYGDGAGFLGVAVVPRSLGADPVEASLDGVVEAVIEAVWLNGLQSRHPVILSFFEESSVFHFRVLPVVFNLFNQREARVRVKVMPRKGEVVIECTSSRFLDIMPMCIKA